MYPLRVGVGNVIWVPPVVNESDVVALPPVAEL